jgi:fumarate hydratase class I
MELEEALVELVRRTSTSLPEDVERALRAGAEKETAGSSAASSLATILENVELARKKSVPMCQDTGTPIFYVTLPVGRGLGPVVKQAIVKSVRKATKLAYLRPNSVCPLSGRNPGDNTGDGFPVIHFHYGKGDAIRVDLLLKGGGSENVGIQYYLPDSRLGAWRDMGGVKKAILDAVVQAGGKGCSPGVLSVVIGGDRSSSYALSKHLFFRKIGEKSRDFTLAALEQEMLENANTLGIGPMGLAGRTTLLDVKIAALHRVPACYFVTVSYGCWAVRRRSLLYRDGKTRFA